METVKQSSEPLRQTLVRRAAQGHRFRYEYAIELEQKHLDACREAGCIECQDAKILISHYQDLLRRGPLPVEIPTLS